MNTNRQLDDLGRITIPVAMRNELKLKKNDMLNISLTIDNKIILEKAIPEPKLMKDKFDIERKLKDLKILINSGFDDDKLLGSVETLEWVLNPETNPNDYLNDYDDKEEE